MNTTTQKKITRSTVKKFIRENMDNLFINVKRRFDGMTDGCEPVNDGFVKAEADTIHPEHTLGIKGAWFVGRSNDYFQPYTNISGDMVGIEVSN